MTNQKKRPKRDFGAWFCVIFKALNINYLQRPKKRPFVLVNLCCETDRFLLSNFFFDRLFFSIVLLPRKWSKLSGEIIWYFVQESD